MDNEDLGKEFYLDKTDPSWNNFFQQETEKDYFWSLLTGVSKEYEKNKCGPRKENIFRLFRIIPLDEIKVVVIGQDPYHLPEVADGIAFSTQKTRYIPASLKNIFLELSRDFNCSLGPNSGNLVPWVKEGVFLINTALTVKDGQALSHVNFGKEFLYSLINYLKNFNEKLVGIFWGQKAKKIKDEFQISDEYSLISAHPSPYSAEHGFFGSCPFSKANQILANHGKSPINGLIILSQNKNS